MIEKSLILASKKGSVYQNFSQEFNLKKGDKDMQKIVIFTCFLIICTMSVAINSSAADISGTYISSAGTVTIRKTDQAFLYESLGEYKTREAALPSEPVDMKLYRKIGKAENAYLVTANIKECPAANIKDRVIFMENGKLANGYLTSYTRKDNWPIGVGIDIEDGVLRFDFPMSTIRSLEQYCGSAEFRKVGK